MKKLKNRVLAEGEVTGHAHRVTVDVFEDDQGNKHFAGETDVTHEEHGKITLPNKKWVSGRVLEYDHFAEEARNVTD